MRPLVNRWLKGSEAYPKKTNLGDPQRREITGMVSTREFRLSEGSSNKFWKITVDGGSHTVQFGRIGTAGQTQTKEFGSSAEAQKSAEKLIQEKVRKGYQEVESSTQTAPSPLSMPTANPSQSQPPTLESTTNPPNPAPAPSREHDETSRSGAQGPLLASSPDPNSERRLDLEPQDWAWATWRPRQPLPEPQSPDFDLDACLDRLARVKSDVYNWIWDWEPVGIGPGMSQEEGEFWLAMMYAAREEVKPSELVERYRKWRVYRKPTLDQFLTHGQTQNRLMAPILIPLISAFGLETVMTTLLERDSTSRIAQERFRFSLALPWMDQLFTDQVLPYLTQEEIERLREIVLPHIAPVDWPNPLNSTTASFYSQPHSGFFLAAKLGMHEDLRAVVDAWQDDLYATDGTWHDRYHRPQEILFGLGSAELVAFHIRRLKLRLYNPELIRAFLAHCEYSDLDLIASSICLESNKDDAEKMMNAFARVHAPEAAPYVLDVLLDSKAARQARAWLEANPAHAAVGLAPVAADSGRKADAAVEYLRALQRKGGEALVEAGLAQLPQEAADALRERLSEGGPVLEPLDDKAPPAWFKEALGQAKVKKSALNWVSAADLPEIRVGDRRLSDGQVNSVLTALAASTFEAPHPLLGALKANVNRVSLDQFAWRLFERWLGDGAPSKEKWAMLALGHLGSDTTALRLSPMIRNWPGEGQHQRAVTGLEGLRAIGTDTALMQINGIAQKVAFKALKLKAGECMEGIAKDRGLTRPQLEDRIVPDCGLDERGTRVLDFGPRQFRLVLGAGMKPMIKDEQNQVKSELPKPTSKDDPELAEQAVADWKLLKKQVSEVVKIQAIRLEQAMVTGRRWSVPDFESLLVRHPLMSNLVRLLVWGVYDADGKLLGQFRVTEDLTYADGVDEAFELDPAAEVGVVHALHLTDEDRKVWGEIFSDYEILPPFPQLNRSVSSLQPQELEAKEITRYTQIKIPPQSVAFGLEKQGWQRGIPQDGGGFYSHSKPYYGANVTAIVEYEPGLIAGWTDGWEEQTLTRAFIIPGIWHPDWHTDHQNLLTLGQVDPVVISEVLSDLSGIASKGK